MLCLVQVLEFKPLNERILFNRTTRPREIMQMMETSFPIVVVFTNKSCPACNSFAQGLENVARKTQGWVVITQVNCELNSSVKFCQENHIKQFPTVMMLNQNPEYPSPPQWDFDDDFSDKSFIEWVYEYRKPIFSVSPAPSAYINYLDAEGEPDNFLFVTKGEWPAIIMNTIRIEINKLRNNITCVQQ